MLEKVYDLLSEYGLFYHHYIGFNLDQLLEKEVAKEIKSPKKHSVNISKIMDVIFNYRGSIKIENFDKFSRAFQFNHQKQLYPEWLFSSTFIRFVDDEGEVVLVFDIASYQEIYNKAFPLMEAGDSFFKKMFKEYKLKAVFDPEKANVFIENSLEEKLNKIAEELDNSETQKELRQRLFELIRGEYLEILKSVENNECNEKIDELLSEYGLLKNILKEEYWDRMKKSGRKIR